MKVILTGCTGYIGGEVLEQCIRHPSITSVVVLSRRPLPEVTAASPKVNVVIVKDFLSYSPATLEAIKGAEACIWSLGKAYERDLKYGKTMTIDYTLAGARAFAEQVDASRGGRKFRFIYVSGMAAVRDQTKSLWFMKEWRRIRGQVEVELLAYAKAHQEIFESYIMRPGMVLTKGPSVGRVLYPIILPSVKLDDIAQAMIKIALNGRDKDTFENADIIKVAVADK